MSTLGRILSTSIVAVLVPAGAAAAAGDTTDVARATATEAAATVAEEHALIDALGVNGLDATERTTLEARLAATDARGAELLAQLDALDIELTQAIRIGLDVLPRPAAGDDPATMIPQGVVYDAAVADLTRIAETPGAVLPAGAGGGSSTTGLLAVAALALVALTAAASWNMLRRPHPTELTALAWSDGLTGLANRRRFDADVEQRGDGPTAAIMVDVDHFKSINDTFGHALGDEILQRVGARLAEHVRYDDVVYRYGGEEFVVLLTDTSTADAYGIAERIVRAVRGIELPDGRPVTVSVGVAGDADAATVVRRADQALYSAKEHGRDRAISSDELTAIV